MTIIQIVILTSMQTFIVKVSGDSLSPKDIREAIWQCSDDLSKEDIIVEQ